MSGILVFTLRILLAASLYGFLGWAIYTLWQDLRLHSSMLNSSRIPAITLEIAESSIEAELPQELSLQEIIIGRDPSCEFSVSDETISSRHARLSFRQNQWWVEDLQSTNGTFLNEEQVKIPTVIISGDELRCGQILFHIRINPNS